MNIPSLALSFKAVLEARSGEGRGEVEIKN